MNFRLIGVILFLALIFTSIGLVFWEQELRYTLPTPVPSDYQAIQVNDRVELPDFVSNRGTSLYFHFYSPDCPCSLFNARQVRELIFSHGDSIEAVIVVPAEADIKKAKSEFGDHLKIVSDPDGQLAKACGVYSTPQAVIIDHQSRLYYRGNYNRARYCTAKATNYAELALLGLLNGSRPPVFDLLATQSYGCELPTSTKSNFPLF